MSRTRIFPNRDELAATMDRIVSREVKHYRTDWTDYDRPAILDEKKTPVATSYTWITRECGTYLFPSAAADAIRSVLECWPGGCNVRLILIGPKACTMQKIDEATALSYCRKSA